jgi:hypothetical protein
MSDVQVNPGTESQPLLPSGITVAGKVGTPRLYDTGEPTNALPLAVTLINLSGSPYVASGGGGGGGGPVTITDGVNTANVASVESAGTNGIMAVAVQGLTGGLPIPVTGSFATASATTTVVVTPTVTASAYTAGQVVGGLLTFANAFRTANSGVIQSISITSKSVQASIGMKLYLFRADPTNTTWTDKTTPAINTADVANLVGGAAFNLAVGDSGLGTVTLWSQSGIGMALNTGSTSLYAVLVTTGALTPASTSDIEVALSILQD